MRVSPGGTPAIDPAAATRLPRPNPAVVFCAVEEGAVLLSTEDETYYGLNAVGARVWSLLPPAHLTLESLCAALAADYPEADPDELASDVMALLDDLLESRLVVQP